MLEADLLLELRRLEESLMQHATRRDREMVSSLLTEDFREFGSSGRVYSKKEILDALGAETTAMIVGEHFQLRLLSAEAALLTYTSVHILSENTSKRALRSSLWVRRDCEWKMLFHQGTSIL